MIWSQSYVQLNSSLGAKLHTRVFLSACILNSTKRAGVELKLLGGHMSNDMASI
jgi:hypothetical protein